ncbi:hypothetical protein WN51_12248 [Melipona quadrifasciata]|uniref:Uncharacterized protein n=1 Tax=Melipona quadrifasciata TaxID=166423 RepID=A0A0N0BGZ8_9HYME|nr:hypothetical protein WN51_12248 [Melipona quadrifasciata]
MSKSDTQEVLCNFSSTGAKPTEDIKGNDPALDTVTITVIGVAGGGPGGDMWQEMQRQDYGGDKSGDFTLRRDMDFVRGCEGSSNFSKLLFKKKINGILGEGIACVATIITGGDACLYAPGHGCGAAFTRGVPHATYHTNYDSPEPSCYYSYVLDGYEPRQKEMPSKLSSSHDISPLQRSFGNQVNCEL